MSIPSNLGLGFQPYLLNHLKTVVGTDACPQLKIDNYGTLNFLQNQQKPQILQLNRPASPGQVNQVQIKYLQRFTPAFTQTTDTCADINVQAYREATVTADIYRGISLYFDDETFTHYMNDAVSVAQTGAPATPVMNEMLEQLMSAGDAIMGALNSDLATRMAANVGINRVTGNNTAQSINIEQNTNLLPLNDGFTKIMQDYTVNLGYGRPQIIGNGKMHAWFLQRAQLGQQQNGMNRALQSGSMDFYYDINTTTTLGTDQILVIQPNAVQLVEQFKFKGFRAGYKGTSYFFTIMLPYQVTPNEVAMVEFDAQLRYYDCPSNSFTDAYYGTTTIQNRGWQLMLSKTCGLFFIPSDAYRNADALYGNNGVLRYTVTNNATL